MVQDKMLRYVVDEKNEKIILLPEKTSVGMAILGDLTTESLSEQAAFALAHLVAGKNVVFYGAPGTGKTRIAKKLCERVCEGYSIETANSEWGNFDIIGGFMLDKDGHPDWQNGVLTKAVIKCTDSLKNGKPYWLILDELNRANLDLAFGKVLTLMDLDYRIDSYLSGKENTSVPLCFRILATMNTYDKALLFSLGYAFMRRFAFIHIPSLLTDSSEASLQTTAAPPQTPKYLEPLRKVILDAALN
jgi:MoxR-like ATPase